MPEGPSIVIVSEKLKDFSRKKIIDASGYANNIDFRKLKGRTIKKVTTHGKHLLFILDKGFVRVHFLLFGSYRINERKKTNHKLQIKTSHGFVNFYACGLDHRDESARSYYDWTIDVMNPKFSRRKALQKLKDSEMIACDALLDQSTFSGVGNIIKNEVLYRAKIHPESKIKKVPAAKQKKMVDEAVKYSFEFLKWRKANVLGKYWEAYTKKKCKRCDRPIYKKVTGKTKRRSFFCKNCQEKYL